MEFPPMFTDTDAFTLSNAPPRRAPIRLDPDDRRQTVMFSGLDCLAGQADLFATDGDDGAQAIDAAAARAGAGELPG